MSEYIAKKFSDYPQQPRFLPDADNLHILAVLNTYSSNHKRALKQFDALQVAGFTAATDYIETAITRRDTAQVLSEKLMTGRPSYDAVIGLAGDGASNMVAQVLHNHLDEQLAIMPFIYGRGGGACDGHALTQHNTPDYIATLPGQTLAAVFPIEICLQNASQPTDSSQAILRREKAFLHSGIGKGGAIAAAVNDTKHRSSRLLGTPGLHQLREFTTAAEAMLHSHKFYIADIANAGTDFDESPTSQLVSEWLMVNGPRIGRRRIAAQALTEASYQEVIVHSVPQLASYAGQLILGSPNCLTTTTSSQKIIRPSRPGQVLQWHYDGETSPLPVGIIADSLEQQPSSLVSARTSTVPLYIATAQH